MKILTAVVAGALMGVSAVAGPDGISEMSVRFVADAQASQQMEVAALSPVMEALRSGDATYIAIARASRADYVPPRPPL